MQQFHYMQAWFGTIGNSTIRLISYQSVVLDIDIANHTITLYPRWQYSRSTVRHVTRFLSEQIGTVSVASLRSCLKNPETKLQGYSVIQSTDFCYGY